MIVEDDMTLRELYSEMLSLAGFEVSKSVANGQAALEFLRAGNGVDLVITDYRMHGLNGIETIEKIRELAPEAHIILATADGDIKLPPALSPYVLILKKPFGLKEFVVAIESLK